MPKKDFWASIFWAVLGLAIALKSLAYPVGTLAHPAPGFLPFWAGMGIFLLSCCSVIKSMRRPPTAPLFFEQEGGLRRVLITFLSISVYILVVSHLGFLISTLLLLGFLLKTIYPQSWLRTVLFSVLVSVLSFVVFEHWLKVPLPKGLAGF